MPHLELCRVSPNSWVWHTGIFLIWSNITFLVSFPALCLNHSEPQWASFCSLNQCFCICCLELSSLLSLHENSYLSFRNQIKMSLPPCNFLSFWPNHCTPEHTVHSQDFGLFAYESVGSSSSTYHIIVTSPWGDPNPPSRTLKLQHCAPLPISICWWGR